MSTTITAAAGSPATTSPVMIDGYQATRDGRSLIEDTIGGGLFIARVTPRPRSGEIRYLYSTAAAAIACMSLHARDTRFTLASTVMPEVNMAYELAEGGVDVTIDRTRRCWIVTVAFQEVD